MAGKRIVVILPDGGERYANNAVFTEIARKVGPGALMAPLRDPAPQHRQVDLLAGPRRHHHSLRRLYV